MTIDHPDTNIPNSLLLPEGRRWGYIWAVDCAALDAEAALYEAALELLATRNEGAARAFAELDVPGSFDHDVAARGEDDAIKHRVDLARRAVDRPFCPSGAPCAILDADGVPVPGTHRGPAWTAGGRNLFLQERPDGRIDLWADVPRSRPHGLTEWHGRLPLTGAFALVEVSRGWSEDARRRCFSVTVADGAGNPVPAARLANDANLRSALRLQGLDPDRGPVWEVYGD